MQNDRKHRDIKLVTTEYKRNKLAREPNYHSTKCISKHLLVMEMKKTEVKMNKPVYLGQAVLDLSKTYQISYFFCCDDSVKSRRIFKPQYTRYLTTICLLFL